MRLPLLSFPSCLAWRYGMHSMACGMCHMWHVQWWPKIHFLPCILPPSFAHALHHTCALHAVHTHRHACCTAHAHCTCLCGTIPVFCTHTPFLPIPSLPSFRLLPPLHCLPLPIWTCLGRGKEGRQTEDGDGDRNG